VDFTYAGYNRLLKGFRDAGYRGVSVREAADGLTEPLLLMLRHDVEWDSRKALALAEAERANGYGATYHFRVDTNAYDLDAMHRLQDEGFDVGYHYCTLDRCQGDFERAMALFEEDIARLREAGIDVRTVTAHSNPRIKKVGYNGNVDLFDRYPGLLERNGLIDHGPCLKQHYPDYVYIADYGVRWTHAASTRKLIEKAKQEEWRAVHILAHPDYWSGSLARAVGIQVAARGLRLMRLNSVIATFRHLVNWMRRT
jgi:hypothetical protein